MLKILKKFFKFCKKENRNRFYLSILLGVIQAIFEALKIPAIYIVIRDILNNNVTKNTALTSFIVMLISIIGASIIKYFSTMLQTEAGYYTCADKRMEIAEHLRYLPMGYFNQNSLGEITSVTTNTMQNLENVATRVVMLVSQGIIMTILITIMLAFFDYRIALILLLGIIIYLFCNSLLQKASQKVSVKKYYSDSKLVEKVLEYIQGIEEVKSYQLFGEKSIELNTANEESVNANIKMEMKLIPYMTLQNFVAKTSGVIMVLTSIILYLNNTMSLLNTIIMIISSFIIYASLEQAGNYSGLLRTVDVSVDKANSILNTKQMNIEGENIIPKNYDIEIKNIDFAYEKKKIIDDISLKIGQNTTTAIVGPSGGGKTTLTHLIARFFDVDRGEITLGGRNIKDYDMDALMKNFSFVFQDVFLFHDTILNNIKFGVPEASLEEVKDACKKACCDKFIEELPEGYNTIIGENGISLSGGERQRISIARAIMKNSPIVILDEATANVDPENESELINAIEELTKEKTIIMIAHRLKTVVNADLIVVVDKGKIVEFGTHESLIEKEGIYKSFISERKKAVSWKI